MKELKCHKVVEYTEYISDDGKLRSTNAQEVEEYESRMDHLQAPTLLYSAKFPSSEQDVRIEVFDIANEEGAHLLAARKPQSLLNPSIAYNKPGMYVWISVFDSDGDLYYEDLRNLSEYLVGLDETIKDDEEDLRKEKEIFAALHQLSEQELEN